VARLIDSDAWAAFVRDAAKGGSVDFRPVFQMKKAQDVADLCQLLMGKAGNTRDAALRFLFALCMHNDPNVRPGSLGHLCAPLKEYVFDGYPEKLLGQSAWTFWRRIDPGAAAEYLRTFVKSHVIGETNFERITIDLTFGNAESLALLREVVQANANLKPCKTVTNPLDRSDSEWKKKAARLGSQWRKKRDYSTLEYLTNQTIEQAAPGTLDASSIVKLLGEPDSLVGGCYTFFSNDGTKKKVRNGFLYFEADAKGKITGCKLERTS
jgi:hypothetical protein